DLKSCAQGSVRDGERLEGSAEMVTAWLMLEHRPAWSAKPFDDGSLPDAQVAWLKRAAATLKSAGFSPRLQLIRHPSRAADDRVLFVQLARAGAFELYGFKTNPGVV